jgi:hypothetical protein
MRFVTMRNRFLASLHSRWEHRDWDQAAEHWGRKAKRAERRRGAGDPGSLDAREQHAAAELSLGHQAEAAAEFDAVAQLRAAALGADHKDTLRARVWHAQAHHQSGRYAEAEPAWQMIITERGRLLGAQHPDTLAVRLGRVATLRELGRLAEALAEVRDLADTWESVAGHFRSSLQAGRWQATILRDLGEPAQAAEVQLSLLATASAQLGEGHSDTLLYRSEYARTLCGQNRYAEAEAEYRALIPRLRAVTGQLSRETLGARAAHADTLRELGRPHDAEAELTLVTATLRARLGSVTPLLSMPGTAMPGRC